MGLSGEFDVTVVLNWDQYDNPETDLYLYASDGTEVMSSVYPQGPWYGPVEAVWATYDGGQAPYHVVVMHESGPTTGLDMTLVSYYNDLEHQVASSSIGEPGDAHGAFTVGAVNRGDWSNPSIAGYSGQGPTNDGRDKPDLVAPDGTDCETYGEAYGTSMSSPTLAGAAALLLEADPSMSAEMVGHTLRVMAEDTGDAGYDHVFGAGLLDLPLDPCIDGDGYGSGAFGNAWCALADMDCDDTEASTYPGAADDWYDGVDSDCGGEADYDQDGDGHDSDAHGGGDCDDTDPALNPDADDPWYDGEDTNCDGANDFDADGDGFASDQYEGEDCDDEDAEVHPDAAEDCEDTIDNDCDGLVDLDDDECDPGDDDDSAAGDDDDTTDDDDDGEPLDDDDDGGCKCNNAVGGGSSALWLAGPLVLLWLRRRRTGRGGP